LNPSARHGVVWRRAILLTLLCAALAAIAASEALHGALMGVLEESKAVVTQRPVAGALLFAALAAVSAMVAFVSIAVLAPVAVYTWGAPVSIALLWAGWIAGGATAYCIARFLGRPIVRWVTANAVLVRLERRVTRTAPFLFVLLLQLALPSEIPGYLLGLVRYPFWRYLAAVALGELPYALATVYLGATFVEARSGRVLLIGLALAAVSVSAFYLLRRRLHAAAGGVRRPHAR
jgi:uncharacterized membrane protein YdjX (TVP38/TMEM64 family)